MSDQEDPEVAALLSAPLSIQVAAYLKAKEDTKQYQALLSRSKSIAKILKLRNPHLANVIGNLEKLEAHQLLSQGCGRQVSTPNPRDLNPLVPAPSVQKIVETREKERVAEEGRRGKRALEIEEEQEAERATKKVSQEM